MDPKTFSKHPNPADNNLPTKGSVDTQSAAANHITNQPRPDSAPTAAPATTAEAEDTTASESEIATEVPTDPTAAGTPADMGGDTDPGASNTSHDEPL